MIQDILGRVQRLLLSPGAEWDAISGESANMGDIYKNYVLPLVVFSAVAGAVGTFMLGLNVGFVLRSLLVAVIVGAASVYLFALIIDALAPTFGGQKNAGQALKVAAYAPTAAWVASVFNIIPASRIFLLLGLYSLYLLYVGLPKLMHCPEDKALVYTIVIFVCAFVGAMILTFLLVPLIVGASMF
jgi:hypothetical protein